MSIYFPQRCQTSRFWRDIPIFKSKLNVPRGTGSVLLFGDNSTVRVAWVGGTGKCVRAARSARND